VSRNWIKLLTCWSMYFSNGSQKDDAVISIWFRPGCSKTYWGGSNYGLAQVKVNELSVKPLTVSCHHTFEWRRWTLCRQHQTEDRTAHWTVVNSITMSTRNATILHVIYKIGSEFLWIRCNFSRTLSCYIQALGSPQCCNSTKEKILECRKKLYIVTI